MNIAARAARPVQRVLLALACVTLLSAFRHTDVEGHTDPNYAGYTFRTVVVRMPNLSLSFERQVAERLGKALAKRDIRMLLHDDLFPPMRAWSPEEVRAVYERHGVDAGIVITLGNFGSQSTPGMIMYDATTYGGTTSGTITQVKFYSDNASFSIAIVDAESGDTVWIGELDTRGAGLLFTGQKSTANGLVKGLVREWKSAGHLPR